MTQVTLQDLEQILDMSVRSIQKRPIQQYLSNRKKTNGRPINFYSIEVLKLFPNVNLQEFDIYNYAKPKTSPAGADKSLKKSRSDVNTPRRPTGLSLEARIKLEKFVTDTALSKYLSQSNKFNVKGSIEDACKTIILMKGLQGFESFEDMFSFYYKRITRKDGYYLGACYKDNWKFLWESNFDKPKLNTKLPKNSWAYYELFNSEDLIGNGFGAGQLWTIDATQLDIWVDINGKKVLTNFFCIIDVITGYPLIINPIENESAGSVIDTIIKCVNMWGVPKYGFILDNSSAFRSQQVVGFINLLFSEEDIIEHNKIKMFKQIFGSNDIIKYPIPNIPQYFGKAKLERTFKEFNEKFTTNEKRALSRKSGTEKNNVKLEVGTVPKAALKNAQSYEIVLADFLKYVAEEYSTKPDYSQRYLMNLKIFPSRINAFIFHGGEELRLNPKMPFNVNDPKFVYYSTHQRNRHKITVEKVGEFRINSQKIQTYYRAGFLTFRDMGIKIVAIPNPLKEREMLCYLEYNQKQKDDRVPNEGDVLYLGIATDSRITSKEELSKIKQRASLQRLKMSEINEAKYISDEVRELLEFEKELNKAKDFNNLESDKRYLDKAKDLIRNQYLLEGNSEIEISEESDLEDYYDSLTDNFIDLSQSSNLIDLSKDIEVKTNNENNIGHIDEIDLDNLDDIFDFKF